MAQYFLLSATARTLSAAKIMRMSERGVENVVRHVRWPDGKPVCPSCGCTICYQCRRRVEAPRWRSKACRGDFSLTSGTLFAWHKLPVWTAPFARQRECCRHAWEGRHQCRSRRRAMRSSPAAAQRCEGAGLEGIAR